ncbi:MAG: Crp/Fnr family transcriptional regulator [Candidatus Margulisbacteria bacterium]|nr:Crp/Fnr family transcriptional regulator [Candidatus Margulisiibacteriota bacterium]
MKNWEKRLIELGEKKICERGSFLFCAQDPFEGIYYVLSGELCTFRMGAKGHQLELIRTNPGGLIGIPPLLTNKSVCPAFCHAVKNSEVIFVKKSVILKELEKNIVMLWAFAESVADKFCNLTERMDTLYLKTPEQRLIMHILSSCAKNHPNYLKLDSKKADLAKQLDMAPETFSRILNKLQKEKAIKVDRNVIYLKDSLGLRKKLFS